MPAIPSITFDAPIMLAMAGGMGLAILLVGVVRRVSVSWPVAALMAAGLGVLAMAAGEPRVRRDGESRIAVLVDVSASMRGAGYHDTAALHERVKALLDERPYSVIPMSDPGAPRTTWAPPPPDAAAVLLFSDGRFDPPATAPPVYPVIDPSLQRPGDAAVTSLQRREDRLIVTTSSDDEPRALAVGSSMATAPAGTRTITVPSPDAPTVVAQLSAGDRWPENDALTLVTPPPPTAQRWWIGQNPPDDSYRQLDAGELPADPAAWLAPSVVVLHNVPATALSSASPQHLQQYVRDLGGGVLILGGDQAFAAGGYGSSVLDAISPLASNPPQPAAHWMFLLDASGSMAGASAGRSRLDAALAAARAAIDQLPPHDQVSVGGFSDELRWWVRGASAAEVTLPAVAPPRGPTNLEPALRALASSLKEGLASPIVLMTDGQVQLPAVEEIAASLAAAGARVYVLAIGDGPGLPALRRLTALTDGSFAQQPDAAQWAAALSAQLRAVTPKHWMTTPAKVDFDQLPDATASAWNRTWLKPGAKELARTANDEAIPMAARMNVGIGQSAAVAFRPPDGHITALADGVAAAPRDPRFRVSWRTRREVTVTIDATTDAAFINDLSPTLVLTTTAGATQTLPVPQTGPGLYELTLPAPRETMLATLRAQGRVVHRFALAGRYAPEFDGIGNDRAALDSLAGRTGGRVIEPQELGPLELNLLNPRRIRLTPALAAAGALLIGFGLVAWRMGR